MTHIIKRPERRKGDNEMNKAIILTRMYAGEYLKNNIGHEIINLFRDDKGKNYIYINEDGKITPQFNDNVHAIFLVSWVEKGVMEILAKAEDLEQVLYKTNNIDEESSRQIKFIESHDIKYGGVLLHKVYGEKKAEKICITFKTNKLRKVKEPLYLIQDKTKLDMYKKQKYIFLPEPHFSSQSLKIYYSEKELPKDYKILKETLENNTLWQGNNTTKQLDINNGNLMRQSHNFLSIIKKEDDELVFSNIMAYLFEQNKILFMEFAKKVLNIKFSNKFTVYREKDNIDLWIEDDSSIIIIENKIKSKINGAKYDIYNKKNQSQLSKYYKNAQKEANENGKKLHCFIFSPNYNLINLEDYESGKHYSLIKYSQIHNFYFSNAGRMLHTNYAREFIEALELHSKTSAEYNFEIMRNRLISKIRGILDNSHL